MTFVRSGLGNRTTLGHPLCQAVVACFHSVTSFIVTITLHLHLPCSVDLDLYLAMEPWHRTRRKHLPTVLMLYHIAIARTA
jgi:hypothetical protein